MSVQEKPWPYRIGYQPEGYSFICGRLHINKKSKGKNNKNVVFFDKPTKKQLITYYINGIKYYLKTKSNNFLARFKSR